MKFKSSTEYTSPDSQSRRVISEAIDSRIDVYISLNTPETIMSKFFGTNDLTKTEREKFFIYFKHVARRICAAHIEQHKDGAIPDLVDFLNNKIAKVLAHDVSHSVEFAKFPRNTDNSLLQDFLKKKINVNKETPDKQLFKETEEELFAALFQLSNGLTKPLSLEILESSFDDRISQELKTAFYGIVTNVRDVIHETLYKDMSVFNNYVYKYIIITLFLRDFNQAYNDTKGKPSKSVLDYLNKKLNAYEAIASGNISPELVDILYYIWDHREDERVLVNLFFMLTESFFKKLEVKYVVV